jgi:hypothetical protein
MKNHDIGDGFKLSCAADRERFITLQTKPRSTSRLL